MRPPNDTASSHSFGSVEVDQTEESNHPSDSRKSAHTDQEQRGSQLPRQTWPSKIARPAREYKQGDWHRDGGASI